VRWATQVQEDYEAEQALMGDLAGLDEPATNVRVKAGAGKTGADVVALLDTIRGENPDAPFWKGVRRIAADGQFADVEWYEPIAPRPLDQGDSTVECHLYDEEALAEAKRRRDETTAVGVETF
jgi:hypothetical protein